MGAAKGHQHGNVETDTATYLASGLDGAEPYADAGGFADFHGNASGISGLSGADRHVGKAYAIRRYWPPQLCISASEGEVLIERLENGAYPVSRARMRAGPQKKLLCFCKVLDAAIRIFGTV